MNSSMNDNEKKIIFFDFDGVIADTVNLSHRTYNSIWEPVTLEEYTGFFNGNIYDAGSVSKTLQDGRSLEEYFALYHPHILEQVLFPGVKEVLKSIYDNYPLLFIISSNSERIIGEYMMHHGLNSYFKKILAAETHTKKTVKMMNILEEYEAKPSDAVIVTDTLGDIKEATSISIGSIAVTWGFHDKINLLKGNPYKLIEVPEHLPDAIRDYFEERKE